MDEADRLLNVRRPVPAKITPTAVRCHPNDVFSTDEAGCNHFEMQQAVRAGKWHHRSYLWLDWAIPLLTLIEPKPFEPDVVLLLYLDKRMCCLDRRSSDYFTAYLKTANPPEQ